MKTSKLTNKNKALRLVGLASCFAVMLPLAACKKEEIGNKDKFGAVTKISLSDFTENSIDKSSLTFTSSEYTEFPVDIDFLTEKGYDQKSIDFLKEYSADTPVFVEDGDKTYYFVYDESMTQVGTRRYRIDVVSADGTKEEVYVSDDETAKEIFSAVVYNGELYWSEAEYHDGQEFDQVTWAVKKLSRDGTVSVIADEAGEKSFINPILSANKNGIYWFEADSATETANAKYSIEKYDGKLSVAKDGVIVNNPYSRVQVTENDFVYLEKDSKDNSGVLKTGKTAFDTDMDYDLIGNYDFSDKYIVWEKLPAKNNYTAEQLLVVDRANSKNYALTFNDSGLSVSGFGIANDYVYLNIGNNSETSSLGFTLLDVANQNLYTNSKAGGWVYKTISGDLYLLAAGEIVTVKI